MTGAPPPHIRVSGAAPNAELSPSDVARIERCVLREPLARHLAVQGVRNLVPRTGGVPDGTKLRV
jgi:hypothetical protein